MEDYIVSGSTKSGIAYTVDTRVRKDSRFLHLLVKMQDKKRAELERAEALFSLLVILGCFFLGICSCFLQSLICINSFPILTL